MFEGELCSPSAILIAGECCKKSRSALNWDATIRRKNNKFCPLVKLINFTGSVPEDNVGVPLDETVWTSNNSAKNDQSMVHSNSEAKQRCCSLLQ